MTAFVLLVSAAAASPNVVGKWTGKLVFDMSKMTKPQNASQQKFMDEMVKRAKQMRVNLTLNPNKTFKAIVLHSLNAEENKEPIEGTWSQSGNSLALVPNKSKSPKADPLRKMIVSADGKRMTATIGEGNAIVFTR